MRRLIVGIGFVVLGVLGAARGGAPAAAAGHPDFSGTFKLDRDASDSLDELLKAVGASWLERKAAAAVTVTQVVRHRGEAIEIRATSAGRSRTDTVRIGAGWESRETEMGKGRARTDWAADGTTLTTRMEVTRKGGQPAVFLVHRSLTDGGKTTVQALELRLKNGKVYRARRLLRRVGSK